VGSDGTRDYYTRLEVKRGASRDDIIGAYRRLAMGAHPDAHPEDPEAAGRFREITEAYEVLGDPKRREAYDRQLGGARIQVRMNGTSGGDGSSRRAGGAGGAGPWRHHEAPPVFLSASRSRQSGAPLGVWPLAPGRGDGPSAEAVSADRWISEISDLFRRIVELWWDI
jgi:DnaJ-class molecular chaperone